MHGSVLGIDIGGTGVKGAPVQLPSGEQLSERLRIETPHPATPPAVATVVGQIVEHFAWNGPIGCTFPGVIRSRAVVETAANLDKSWIGVDAAALFGSEQCPVTMINDADAAGLAEMELGRGKDSTGVVLMLTIGTGLGTAIFNNGVLLPNSELGHLEIDGFVAEHRASSRAMKAEGLSMAAWAKRLEHYLHRIEDLLSPDLFIIGGGISKKFDEFAPHLSTRARIEPAVLRNHAGIVGAAMAAANPMI